MTISITDSKKSLANFSHHLTELTDEGLVNLETEEQVKFFLNFLDLFKVDNSEIRVFGYQCTDIDGEPDYETNSMRYEICSQTEGYLIVLGDLTEEEIAKISGVSNADDYHLEDETEFFINVGGV